MAHFTVTTNCKTCGSVSIEPGNLRLHLEEDPLSYFSTNCSICGRLLGGKVGTQVAMSLMSRGASIADGPFSPEILERPDASPIDPNEVEKFHSLLETDDWFDQLEQIINAGDV